MSDGNAPLSPEAENRLREAKQFVKSNLNNTNERVIERDLWTPDRYYLDFNLCKDYTLGCVYYLIANTPRFKCQAQALLKQIAEGIPKWQDRIFDDFDRIYPDFPIRWVDIEPVLNNPALHDEIFRISPNTVFYTLLRDDLASNVNHSHVRGKYAKIYVDVEGEGKHLRAYDPILFTINTFPLTLSEPIKQQVGQYLADLYKVDIKIISRDPISFSENDTWLKGIEQFYIEKIGTWTKNPFIRDAFYEYVGYIEKNMSTIPLFDPRMDKVMSNNPAWFKDAKFMARALFEKDYRHTVVGDPKIAMDAVMNHMCLFIDLTWSPTIATRFTLPDPEPSRTEELSEQMINALNTVTGKQGPVA